MKVGVLLVGGFLGAGKTTLLQKLVADPLVGGRIAVLVNELGTLGLDGELIAGARESSALRTVQLDSGCICCTLKGELGAALLELARPTAGEPPLQIIVELSGAALASEVHFSIAAQELDAPYYADGLVCVVDAHAAERANRDAHDLFVDQLSRADLVLLSKLDLATEDEASATRALIDAIAPGARVLPCTRGDVDPQLLLGLDGRSVPDATHAHAHALRSRTLELSHAIELEALHDALEDVSPALFRIKGVVDVVDGGTQLVQCVGDQIAITPITADSPRRLVLIGLSDRIVSDAAGRLARVL